MQALMGDEELASARGLLVSTYRQLVEHLPCVEAVHVDQRAGLTVYTVYRGELRAVEDSLYRAESEARRQAPRTGTMFRLLSGREGEDVAGLPRSARYSYRRG
jgi:hypothetical protein